MTAMELEKDKTKNYEIVKDFDEEINQARQYVQTVSENWDEIKIKANEVSSNEINY